MECENTPANKLIKAKFKTHQCKGDGEMTKWSLLMSAANQVYAVYLDSKLVKIHENNLTVKKRMY